jgi:hypothetical protein
MRVGPLRKYAIIFEEKPRFMADDTKKPGSTGSDAKANDPAKNKAAKDAGNAGTSPSSASGSKSGPNRSASARKPVVIEGEANAPAKAGAEKSGTSVPKAGAKPGDKDGTTSVKSDSSAKASPSTNKPPLGRQDSSLKDSSSKSSTVKTEDGSDKKTSPDASKPTAAAKPSTPKSPPAAKKSSGGSALSGGLIGGALVAILGSGFLYWQTGSFTGAPSGDPQSGVAIEELSQRISAIENTDAANGSAGDAAENDELLARIAELEARLESIGTGESAVSDVQAEIARLDTAIAEARSEARGELSQLTDQLASGASGDGAASAAQAQKITTLEETSSEISSNFADLQNELGSFQSDIGTQISSLSEAVTASQTQLEDVSAGLSDLESQVASVSEQVSAQSSGRERAEAALTAAALTTAIESGQGFAEPLAAFATMVGESPSVEALRPYAESGVPTLASLQADFGAVVDEILAATKPQAEGVGNKFMSNLQSLVTVRPAGEVEGEGPRAIVGRMTAALQNGNLDRVLSEAETLPEAGQAAASEFLGKVRARAQANSLLSNILSGASGQSSEGATQ